MRVFGRKILYIKEICQGTIHPALIDSKTGSADGIRYILKGACSSPRSSVAWVFTASVLIICLVIGVAFAQNQTDRSKGRIAHFPGDRSVGQLSIQDSSRVRRITYWFHWGDPTEWEYLGQAQGDVHVPAGKRLRLSLNKTAWRDLSWLSKLRPDDLYMLLLPALSTDPVKPSDGCMPHIARLAGLRSLNLGQTDVTDKGLRYIKNLKSLEYLDIPPRLTDRGMAYIAELTTLKGLYLGGVRISQVTDAGLRHLSKLTSLEELYLRGERMSDDGLAYLRALPRLEYLCLFGSHFTDRGMVHIKAIPSLRILSFHQGLCQITDVGMVQISEMPKLQILCLHEMKNITDDGLAHLSKLRSLKKLNIGGSQVTDRGLAYLSQIKTLEHLDLPQRQKGITDKGLAYLGTLPNLKYLSISRTHFNDPKMNKEYYTDKGLAELAKCRLLEELNIGSIGITDDGIDHILKLKNMEKLMLFGCDNVTDKGLTKLTALKSLRELFLTGMSIEGLNSLQSMPNLTSLTASNLKRNSAVLDLSGLTELEKISLDFRSRSKDVFTDADLKCLAKLKRIKWLQMSPRNYTDKGLAYLAGLTNMKRLGIGGSDLTDEGLKHLTGMKKLNHLSILKGFDIDKRDYASGGDITDEGLRQLEELKQLNFLNIYSDNDFSDAALRRLWKKLPNLFTLRINGGKLLNIGDGRK